MYVLLSPVSVCIVSKEQYIFVVLSYYLYIIYL